MSDAGAVLAAFHASTGRHAALCAWRADADGEAAAWEVLASSPAFAARVGVPPRSPELSGWLHRAGWVGTAVPSGDGPAWLVMEPGPEGETRLLEALLPALRRVERERDGATTELAERYEEISLLYTIGELLGAGQSVEAVAGRLLHELALTVGATRAVLLVADPAQHRLEPVATLGLDGRAYPAVDIDDPVHVAARAFRRRGVGLLAGASSPRDAEALGAPGAPVLAVPVTRVGQGGAPLGVVLLAGEPGARPFTAGDRKLVTAVATQVGTALHNARLVQAALERERFARELRLAQELQLKLLPEPAVVGPEARAAARVVAADHVGGDFYLLVRLDAGRTAAVIGDVSGHGYQAALVMALALSATAIHLQGGPDPAVVLDAVGRSLHEELAATEMSLTLCCAVIDAGDATVRWANAGHPHAFRVRGDGRIDRLHAHGPPLGLGRASVPSSACPWGAGDRLLLFTDGAPDARDAMGRRLGEDAVVAAALGSVAPAVACDAIVHRVRTHAAGTPLRDDLAVVVVERLAAASA